MDASPTARRAALDFSRDIDRLTKDFTGREWIFGEIDSWLLRDDERFLILTGEPGSGKSAIAARLVQFSQGLPAPEGLRLTRDFLSAVHFCSTHDTFWKDPFIFAGSIATQLANRHENFRNIVMNLRDDRQAQINVIQNVHKVEGQVIGVVINVNGPSPESAFNRVVREPIEMLYRKGFDKRMVILVDALDEALTRTGPNTIIDLLSQQEHLPAQVRFILTSRPEGRVTSAFRQATTLHLANPAFSKRNHEDIGAYIQHRLAADERLSEHARTLKRARLRDLVATINRSAAGNFLYVPSCSSPLHGVSGELSMSWASLRVWTVCTAIR